MKYVVPTDELSATMHFMLGSNSSSIAYRRREKIAKQQKRVAKRTREMIANKISTGQQLANRISVANINGDAADSTFIAYGFRAEHYSDLSELKRLLIMGQLSSKAGIGIWPNSVNFAELHEDFA